MIGYIQHGSGVLSPPSPTIPCRICECAAYSYYDLENGLCDQCVEEYVCIECGKETETTNKHGVCAECEHENH